MVAIAPQFSQCYTTIQMKAKSKKNSGQRGVSAKLRAMRRQKDLTQFDLAKSAGISPNYYAKIERGEVNTSIEKLQKIVRALGVRYSDILPQ